MSKTIIHDNNFIATLTHEPIFSAAKLVKEHKFTDSKTGKTYRMKMKEYRAMWKELAGGNATAAQTSAPYLPGDYEKTGVTGEFCTIDRDGAVSLRHLKLFAPIASKKPSKKKATAKVTAPKDHRRNIFAVCLDRSASMSSLTRQHVLDTINNVMDSIKDGAAQSGQDTLISTFDFGGTVTCTRTAIPVAQYVNRTQWSAGGSSTPLFECIGRAMKYLESLPEAADPQTSFFIYVITDGEENSSYGEWQPHLVNNMIKQRQATDRWTFAIQLPKDGVAKFIRDFAVPAGNVQGWDVSDQGLGKAAAATTSGISSYYTARSTGAKSIQNVYRTDLSAVKLKDLKSDLTNMTGSVKFWNVKSEQPINEFLEQHTKKPYVIGSGWYQLTKPEKVQSYKQIAIRLKDTKEVFGGKEARRLIGIDPNDTQDVKVIPGNMANMDIFIMSTSVNRKLVRGTDVMFMLPTGPVRETWDSAAAKAAADLKAASSAPRASR